MAAISKYFFASSPETKCKLTQNLSGSIGVTCRSKIVKLYRSVIQDGRNDGHLENLFFAFSPQPKHQLS